MTNHEIESGQISIEDLTNAIRGLDTADGRPMFRFARTAVAFDRVRVRYGLMPITRGGAKYYKRRRRQARKKRRGYP